MEIHWEGAGRQVIFNTQRVGKGNKKSILKTVDKKLKFCKQWLARGCRDEIIRGADYWIFW